MEILLFIFLLGVLTPIQTAANSRLRLSVGSPLVASLVSFAIGSIFLTVATLFEKGTLGISTDIIAGMPWWAWLGGICGLYGLTVNIIIFPKLGSVQTALMPMLGQITAGVLIDAFGWLKVPVHGIGITRVAALCLILVGIFMVVHKKNPRHERRHALLPWQIIGFSGGAVFAMQPPMNGLLSEGLGSSIHAALITFYSATFLLLVIVAAKSGDRCHLPKIFSLGRPWWSWLGGIIGGTFVTGFAFFVTKVGVGVLLVTNVCGMLAMSLIIDKFGILGTAKKQIRFVQYAGLLLVVVGTMILRLY